MNNSKPPKTVNGKPLKLKAAPKPVKKAPIAQKTGKTGARTAVKAKPAAPAQAPKKLAAALIYALCCPNTGEVRYIGKANDPATRFRGHLRETRRASPLYSWIARLRKTSQVPEIRVIASAIGDWQGLEQQLIAQYRDSGTLLNLADGGDQPICPREVRVRNGKNSALLRVSTPERQRIYEIKRSIGQLLKDGCVNAATKAKLRNAAQRRPDLFGAWAAL